MGGQIGSVGSAAEGCPRAVRGSPASKSSVSGADSSAGHQSRVPSRPGTRGSPPPPPPPPFCCLAFRPAARPFRPTVGGASASSSSAASSRLCSCIRSPPDPMQVVRAAQPRWRANSTPSTPTALLHRPLLSKVCRRPGPSAGPCGPAPQLWLDLQLHLQLHEDPAWQL